ncbi:MAG: acyltransferase [Alphaproteobacteria bacterium]
MQSGIQDKSKTEPLLSIQYVRAIAATSVLWWHITEQKPLLGCALGKIGHFGDFGVDLFFVVSGFVMVLVTTNRESRPSDFMTMRAIRIVPIYWLYTFAAAAVLLIRPGLFSSNELTWRHFLLSLAFIPHALAKYPTDTSPLIKIGWTLNYEMFFYVLFALSMLVSYRRRVVMTGAIITGLVLVGLFGIGANTVLGTFFTRDIMLEFVFGMAIASLPRQLALGWGKWSTMAVIAGAGLCLIVSSFHQDWPRALRAGVPAGAMVWGLVALERRNPLARNAPLLEIGNASYSVYLFQLYPIAVFRALAEHTEVASCRAVPATTFVLACLGSVLVGGVLSYRLIEKPTLKLLHQAVGSLRPRTT